MALAKGLHVKHRLSGLTGKVVSGNERLLDGRVCVALDANQGKLYMSPCYLEPVNDDPE